MLWSLVYNKSIKPVMDCLGFFGDDVHLCIGAHLGRQTSLPVRKPTICICENKDADQLCGNCTADQHLCYRHTDSTIPLLTISKFSSFKLYSVTVQPGLCWTWSEPKLLAFSHTDSNTKTQVSCTDVDQDLYFSQGIINLLSEAATLS